MAQLPDEMLAQLRQDYPTEAAFNRVLLPRLGLVSQDITEGKGKSKKVTTEAGTFFIERQGEEEDPETKQKKWVREEIGTEAEGIILFQRKQLKYYDEAKEEYTSSPVYDTDDEEIPLFLNKSEVERGTPAELKKLYPGVSKSSGKAISLLEDNRILYVMMDIDDKAEIFQMNLRGSSMYSFMTYARKTLPPSVVTKFGSEEKEKGSIEWNMMTFEPLRSLTKEEAKTVIEKITEIKNGIAAEKAYFQATAPTDEQKQAKKEAEKKFKDF